MALLLEEVRRLPILPLSLPFPEDRELARRCRRFVKDPNPHETIDDWAENLGQSRRSFTRLFKRETGMSFAAWQRQACLFSALPRLVAREPITQVALDLGYESPAAFTTMFKKALGVPPSDVCRRARPTQLLRRQADDRRRSAAAPCSAAPAADPSRNSNRDRGAPRSRALACRRSSAWIGVTPHICTMRATAAVTNGTASDVPEVIRRDVVGRSMPGAAMSM